MFENLQVSSSSAFEVIDFALEGNPFAIHGIVGTVEGNFTGCSFLEVKRNGEPLPDALPWCASYGVEHQYKGEDKDELDSLCSAMNEALEERYGIHFLARDPVVEPEEPIAPTEENPDEVGSLEEVLNGEIPVPAGEGGE